MMKYILYALSLVVLTACGDGYAGGPEDTPPDHLAEIELESDEGDNGKGMPYFKKEGKGDTVFKTNLKKGVAVIVFNHFATYKADRDKYATIIIMKDGIEQYVGQKTSKTSIDRSEDPGTYTFMVLETDGTHTITIYVPSVNDWWELAFIEKSKLSPEILELAPNAKIHSELEHALNNKDLDSSYIERYILTSDELEIHEF